MDDLNRELRNSLENFQMGFLPIEKNRTINFVLEHKQIGLADWKYVPKLKHRTSYREKLEWPKPDVIEKLMPSLIHSERQSFDLQGVYFQDLLQFDNGEQVEEAVSFEIKVPPAQGVFHLIAPKNEVITALDEGHIIIPEPRIY